MSKTPGEIAQGLDALIEDIANEMEEAIGNGLQAAYKDIRESLSLVLSTEILDADMRQRILVSLDDAISNNWDHLMNTFAEAFDDE